MARAETIERAKRPGRTSSTLTCALAALLLLGTSASDPTATVSTALTRVETIVGGSGTRDEKLPALMEATRDLLDTDAMARRAMGRELTLHPQAQQDEFLRLFDEVIVRRYLQRLLFFRKPEFVFVREKVDGDVATVYTKILTGKDAFYVDYRMRRSEQGWVATDFIIEGISFTGNYRDQFESVLRDRSFEELLELMRRKVDRRRKAGAG